MLSDKRIVVMGGTGSLGRVLVRRLLSGELGRPKKIVVFSRDEAKQHAMRLDYQKLKVATDEVIYRNFEQLLQFRIGDIRNYHSVSSVLYDADVVVNAAALKQVPTCEYFPYEAVQTNIGGAENIVRVIRENRFPVQVVVGVSTDKACKPVNVMGMTKAIQERVLMQANLDCPNTRFVCVRYGNVLASRGSVIPLFHEQIRSGGPVTVTSAEMTRFLLSLDQAVDLVFAALKEAKSGETYIPRVPSARIIDVASVLVGEQQVEIEIKGIRPGEKTHEILVSEEEVQRTVTRGSYYVILPVLPELRTSQAEGPSLEKEYSSADHLLTKDGVKELLDRHNLLSVHTRGKGDGLMAQEGVGGEEEKKADNVGLLKDKYQVVVVGAKGMLGRAVEKYLRESGYRVRGLSRKEFDVGASPVGDLSRWMGGAEVVINCAGIIKSRMDDFTADQVMKVNGMFPWNLARWCRKKDMKCFHITTDCVYSGKRGNYTEEDEYDAEDLYGLSKAAGDTPWCMTLRTSIIGEEQDGNSRSLLEWVKSQRGKEINGFVNHRWNGVTTAYLAEIIKRILDEGWYEEGIFHVFSPEVVTKYELVKMIGDVYGLGLKVNKYAANEAVDRSLGTVKELCGKVVDKPLRQQVEEMRRFWGV